MKPYENQKEKTPFESVCVEKGSQIMKALCICEKLFNNT